MQEVPTISPLGVHVAGSFQGWNTRNNILYSFGENIYENIVYVDQTAGSVEYRFCNGVQAAGYETVPTLCSVNGNRELAIKKDTVFDAFCFGSCYACGVQSTGNQAASTNLSIYPNPCKNTAYCNLGSSRNGATLEVYNLTGNQVLCTKCGTEPIVKLDLENLYPGLYFVRLRSNGQTFTKRLTIQ
jgi:hypothetical protein